MPNFKVSRRKKAVVEPQQPNIEEKVDEMELSEDSESSEYIDQAIADVKRVTFEEQSKTRPQTAYTQPNIQPQTPNTPTIVRKPQPQAPYAPPRRPQRQLNDPYSRKPTMDFSNPYTRYRQGGAKMRYRSHYGAGGEHLDTRTKSALLYSHCFG